MEIGCILTYKLISEKNITRQKVEPEIGTYSIIFKGDPILAENEAKKYINNYKTR